MFRGFMSAGPMFLRMGTRGAISSWWTSRAFRRVPTPSSVGASFSSRSSARNDCPSAPGLCGGWSRPCTYSDWQAAMDKVPPSKRSEFFDVDYLARFAIQDHNNKKNALLELEKIVSVRSQVVCGLMYKILLEALDGGQKKSYEAKVWVKPWEKFKEVQYLKPVLMEVGRSSEEGVWHGVRPWEKFKGVQYFRPVW